MRSRFSTLTLYLGRFGSAERGSDRMKCWWLPVAVAAGYHPGVAIRTGFTRRHGKSRVPGYSQAVILGHERNTVAKWANQTLRRIRTSKA